jgi:hypothetical protein
MSTIRHLRAAAALCALACTLAVAAPASAAPRDEERYYSSYGNPAPASSALAQEQYYSSYGEPDLRTAPDPASGRDNTPLLVALCISSALVLVAGGLAGHHLKKRRRQAVPA